MALLVDAVQHPDEILLVVAVVAVAFGDLGADGVECRFHDVVHLPDLYLGDVHPLHIAFDIFANLTGFVGGEAVKNAVCRFIDRRDDFLDVEFFPGMVFLNHIDHKDPSFHSGIGILYHTRYSGFQRQNATK